MPEQCENTISIGVQYSSKVRSKTIINGWHSSRMGPPMIATAKIIRRPLREQAFARKNIWVSGGSIFSWPHADPVSRRQRAKNLGSMKLIKSGCCIVQTFVTALSRGSFKLDCFAMW